MADILLTHSYHLFYDRKQARKMQPYAPLSTLLAAGLLRSAGFSVAVFDTMLEDPTAGFAKALALHRPKLVAVCEDNFNFLTKMCLSRMREVAFDLCRESRGAGAVAVVNGSDANDHALEYLQAGFAAVLLGEGEWTLLDVCREFFGAEGRITAPGIAYLAHGAVARTESRPPNRDLDSLPLPARDLIDIDAYRKAWKQAHGRFSMNIATSRGCPYRCNWCSKPIWGNSFACRSAASVAEEMKQIKEIYGAEHVWFADDIFGLRPSWAEELADEVEARDAAIPFKMQSRVDLMRPSTVSALRRAGCTEVWMGAESGSQKILDAMDKDTTVAEIKTARENLRREGIRACYFLQFGYPGESWEDIRNTIAMVRETRPDDIGVSVSYPLPGTPFYERVRKQMGPQKNWLDSEDMAVMFRAAYSSEFYHALHDALHAEIEQWSAPAPAGIADAAEQFHGADRLRALWAKVEELERTGRTEKPTRLIMDSFVPLSAVEGD
jgi:radical SAM superfamily enzyme YgiQ (UPF0313 family)